MRAKGDTECHLFFKGGREGTRGVANDNDVFSFEKGGGMQLVKTVNGEA